MIQEITEIRPFFNSIYEATLDQLNVEDTITNIKHLQENDNIGIVKSNRGGWQSNNYDYDDYENLFMAPVFSLMTPIIEAVYKNIGITTPAKPVSYWFNINNKYDFNVAHKHTRSYFSAVLYLKTPDACGNLVFERPDPLRDWIFDLELNDNNYGTYIVASKVQKLVIFPAYMVHYVEPNQSDEERISIAFNFK
jgi:uncharacterized protein (TIGR02466 family)